MPIVKKMSNRLFKEDAFEVESQWTQADLLSTIRVPKNLLYLTDKLPKPTYDSNTRRSMNKLSPNAKSTSRKANNTIQDESSMPMITKSTSQSRLPKNNTRANKKQSHTRIDEVSEPSNMDPNSRQ